MSAKPTEIFMHKACWLMLGMLLISCSPTLNWRDTHLDQAPLKIMLPCKADQGSKNLALASSLVTLHMVGCEAGGMMFTASLIKLPPDASDSIVLSQWMAWVISSLNASSSKVSEIEIPSAGAKTPGQKLIAQGSLANGSAMSMQGVWFVQHTNLFHAAIYAKEIPSEVAETFFSSLYLH